MKDMQRLAALGKRITEMTGRYVDIYGSNYVYFLHDQDGKRIFDCPIEGLKLNEIFIHLRGVLAGLNATRMLNQENTQDLLDMCDDYAMIELRKDFPVENEDEYFTHDGGDRGDSMMLKEEYNDAYHDSFNNIKDIVLRTTNSTI